METPNPYVLAISDLDFVAAKMHSDEVIVERLSSAGFDLGPMIGLGASSPSVRREMWKAALAHAGIDHMETGHDPKKGRTWFRVWRKDCGASMIAIVNLGPIRDADLLGPHRYEVRINRASICRFRHARGDGLAECLRRAAAAVEAKHAQDMLKLAGARPTECQ